MKLLNNYEYKIPKIWFHQIKGVQDVATQKELEIANKLTYQRAQIFLESRAYIRKSLGSLFNINPLEIPIIANPGEPPKLPKGIWHCSFRHYNDEIICYFQFFQCCDILYTFYFMKPDFWYFIVIVI